MRKIYIITTIEYVLILISIGILTKLFPFLTFDGAVSGAALIVALLVMNILAPIKTRK